MPAAHSRRARDAPARAADLRRAKRIARGLSEVAVKAFLDLVESLGPVSNAEAAALIGVSAEQPRPDQARLRARP